MRLSVPILAGVISAAALAGGLVGAALAQAAASRALLGAIDVGGTDRHAQMGTATLPEGSSIASHYHPGEELALVTEGEVVLRQEGRPDRLMKAGEVYAIPRGVLHEAAPPAGKSAKVVAVWITDKGQPLAIPAPSRP